MTTARPIVMAAGVQFSEADISDYVRTLSTSILANIGVTQRGKKNQNLLLTGLSQGVKALGIPGPNYPGLQVMREFFNAGGGQMQYVPVANGDTSASTVVTLLDTTTVTLTAPETGTFFNQEKLQVSYGSQLPNSTSATHTFPAGAGTYSYTVTGPVVAGTLKVSINGAPAGVDNGAGVIVFGSGFTAYAGTINYNTGAVVITTTSLGAALTAATVLTSFSAWSSFNFQVIYQVLDSNSNPVGSPYVLEAFRGLTLANMVASLAAAQYLSVPDAFSSFPVANTYTFSGGSDGIEEIEDGDYIGNTLTNPTGMQIFAYPDQVDINLITIPRASQSLAIRQAMIQLCEVSRSDTFAIIDPPPSLSIQTVADWANGNGEYSSYDTIDSTYAGIYYPYYTSYNSLTDENESTPPSALAAAAFARSNPWQAPAGPNRGKALNIIGIDNNLNPQDRAFLGANRINPISDLNGIGTMVLGQYTAALEATSLDRIAARVMLMRIEKAITTALYPLLFEPNTPQTWSQAGMIVTPYLNALVNKEQIYSGAFYCDSTTNTDDVINNNIMSCVIALQLLKYAEIILCTFVMTALGADITESTVSQYANT